MGMAQPPGSMLSNELQRYAMLFATQVSSTRPLRKGYSAQRRNSNAPFVPPNPKELDMAYSTLVLRA